MVLAGLRLPCLYTLAIQLGGEVVFIVEKPFSKADEVVLFHVNRKGYILLPWISPVDYSFVDSVKEHYGASCEINPKRLVAYSSK